MKVKYCVFFFPCILTGTIGLRLEDRVGVGEHEVLADGLVGVRVEVVLGGWWDGDEVEGAVAAVALEAHLVDVDRAVDAEIVDRLNREAVAELGKVLTIEGDLRAGSFVK